MRGKGILLDDNFELVVRNGTVAIGETLIQEVHIILQMNQGELRSDPLLGPNLIYRIKGKKNQSEIKQAVKLALARDRKDYNEIQKLISLS
jgi:hypothetical protein